MHGGVSHLLLGDGSGMLKPVSPDESGLVVPGDATSVTAHDLNRDGKVDFFVGINNGKFESFINQTGSESYALRISEYTKNNYIGSKIWVYFRDNSVQLHEVFAGGGYLSQSAPVIFIGNKKNIKKIIIQWPDGSKNEIDDYKRMSGLSSL